VSRRALSPYTVKKYPYIHGYFVASGGTNNVGGVRRERGGKGRN